MSDGYYYYSWTGNLLRIFLDKSCSLSLKKKMLNMIIFTRKMMEGLVSVRLHMILILILTGKECLANLKTWLANAC